TIVSRSCVPRADSSADRRAGADAMSTSPETATTVRCPTSRRSMVKVLGVVKLDKDLLLNGWATPKPSGDRPIVLSASRLAWQRPERPRLQTSSTGDELSVRRAR